MNVQDQQPAQPPMMAPPAQPQQQTIPQQTMPPGMENIPAEQRQLLMQVLALTPEQINMLPPDQRQNILQLRTQLLQGQ